MHPKYMRIERSAYLFGLRKIQAGMRRVPLLAMLQAIEDDPLDWQAYMYAIDILLSMGRKDEASALAQRVVALYPHLFETRRALGLAQLRCGRLRDAVMHLRVAVRIDPSSEAALQLLWEAEAKMRNLSRSRQKQMLINARYSQSQKDKSRLQRIDGLSSSGKGSAVTGSLHSDAAVRLL